MSKAPITPLSEIDLSKPRYGDQTYTARFRHFLETTSPLNVFASNRKLAEAAALVKAHKQGEVPPGTTEDQLWEAKRLYDSAYHPDTGEKMLLYGRMSFQVPGNMVITGLMITFHRHPLAVTFWQSANQAFNAVVNYTNRSGDKAIPLSQVVGCGLAATTVATTTALTLNKVVKKYKNRVPRLIGRFIPFVAIAAANMINMPLMRWEELSTGIRVTDQDGNKLGDELSMKAAKTGVAQSVLARISIALPILIVPPLVMETLGKGMPSVIKNTGINATLTVILTGLCLWLAVPMGQALFSQTSSLPVSKLEPEVREAVLRVSPDMERVYYNRGL